MRVALLLLPLALASIPPNHPARRHHAKLIARQNNGTDTDTGPGSISPTPTPTPSPPAPSAAPSSSAAPISSEAPSSSIKPSSGPDASSERPASTSAAADTSSADTSSTAPTSLTADTSAASSARTSATSLPEANIETSQTGTVAVTSKSQTVASRTLVKTSTAKASATSSGAAKDEEESGGLPKGALIAIIVCSVVIGVGGIAWTLFRKWKLKPSKGFDQRMQPIDFTPGNDMGDDFFEKTMARDADAERQRQQFCIELDNDSQKDATLVGDIQHDFTAGPATSGYGYQQSPYGAQDYDFSAPHNDWDAGATGYPPQQGAYYNEYPTQDSPDQQSGSYANNSQHAHGGGYADLQRGSSVGHGPAPTPAAVDFGADFAVSGRPTDSSAGPASPYAQAAAYRY
ncbi:hypothetical protein CspeluHIS016_0401920 [Cutaneotrichosporon spelunceum]|uniref:Mid2 domain-containing protein n=1 Tax=Cutaneotrichosporon spelunceum TaxID=1672016 RepID=A0AAD3TUX6_9TREE|nr:hypothetical protein CspeluHIS016_0401920 [Cutaneotrichosporon spelunceum]